MSVRFEFNPAIDRKQAAAEFAHAGRVQVADVLTEASAAALLAMVRERTPWGLAWQAGQDGPHLVRAEQLAAMDPAEARAIHAKLTAAAGGTDYAFLYSSYPLVRAYLERWNPGSEQDALLEAMNAGPFLDLIGAITGETGLIKADGQATLYAPGHFLMLHDDKEEERGRRVAYVLNLTAGEWRPEWGGLLHFYNADLNVEHAFRPRFTSLNLFRVPRLHSVSQVSPFAPLARYAITGWARDR